MEIETAMTNGEKDERWGSILKGLKPDAFQNANAALKRRSFTLSRELRLDFLRG